MIIPFEEQYRKRYYQLLDEVFDSNYWSEGKMVRTFEEKFAEHVGAGARAIANGGAGLYSIFEYIGVRGKDVIVPSNTFWATALAAKRAGASVVYADCNREDLCLSYEDMVGRVTSKTAAVVVVHIGGHIAFDIERIAEFCGKNNIHLIEDCAHAHGAAYKGKRAGTWGLAGSYSFYATKTLPTGDGGMVVSRNSDFLSWLEKYRNYGKEVRNGKVEYPLKSGFNFRMNEITAALGVVQMERLPVVLEWKQSLAEKYDRIFDNRVHLPEGMTSGYYKYVVFDYELREETGKVFGPDDLCHRIDCVEAQLPNTSWVAKHHRCPPIYYGWKEQSLEINALRKVILNDSENER